MPLKTMSDLLEHMLRDMYFAERRLAKVLPKMMRASRLPELRDAFAEHLEETREHGVRLQRVFEDLGLPARGKTCAAIVGLIEEVEGLIDEARDPDTRDAGLIAMAQGVEHYEIARYGTMVAFAEELNLTVVAEILRSTLEEEVAADQKLSALAERRVNARAAA